jgi:hypothetical protein
MYDCICKNATYAEANFTNKLKSPSRWHFPLTYNRESTVPESRKSGVFVWYLRSLFLHIRLLHFCLIFFSRTVCMYMQPMPKISLPCLFNIQQRQYTT